MPLAPSGASGMISNRGVLSQARRTRTRHALTQPLSSSIDWYERGIIGLVVDDTMGRQLRQTHLGRFAASSPDAHDGLPARSFLHGSHAWIALATKRSLLP